MQGGWLIQPIRIYQAPRAQSRDEEWICRGKGKTSGYLGGRIPVMMIFFFVIFSTKIEERTHITFKMEKHIIEL